MTVSDLPDPSLTVAIDQTQPQLSTVGDAYEALGTCRARLKSCAASIDGLREWREGAVKRNEEANAVSNPKGSK